MPSVVDVAGLNRISRTIFNNAAGAICGMVTGEKSSAAEDMCNFWGSETVPAKYKGRLLYRWNPNVTPMRTAVEENTKMGQDLRQKLNKAIGPVAVMIPMGGLSELDYPGKPSWCSEADQAFVDALRKSLRIRDILSKSVRKR